jgi:signal transduction histidine kinase
VVEGYTSLVADLIGAQASQGGAGEALRQPVGELSRSVEVLGLMLDRLRDGWAADQGLRLRREPADLAAIVRETVDDLGSVLTEHPLEVAGPAEVAIDIDVPRIRQVLFNLLTNAEKYSDPGAPVLVTLVDGAEQVCLEVRNHGYGIATDDLEHIFARFSRVDDTAGGGLGIGL